MTVLTLPLPPNRANERGHWAARRQKDQAWERRALVDTRMQYGPLPGPMQMGKAVVDPWPVTVRATLYVYRPMDPDNLVARMKLPLDFLRRVALIARDDPRYLTLEVKQEQAKRADQRLVVEIEA